MGQRTRFTKHSRSLQALCAARTFDEGALRAAVGGGVGGVGHAALPAGVPPVAPLHGQLAVRPACQQRHIDAAAAIGWCHGTLLQT